MIKLFRRRRIARRLADIGSQVNCFYQVLINNDTEPRMFQSKQDLVNFLDDYRSDNSIFALSIYRVEVYSL